MKKCNLRKDKSILRKRGEQGQVVSVTKTFTQAYGVAEIECKWYAKAAYSKMQMTKNIARSNEQSWAMLKVRCKVKMAQWQGVGMRSIIDYKVRSENMGYWEASRKVFSCVCTCKCEQESGSGNFDRKLNTWWASSERLCAILQKDGGNIDATNLQRIKLK